MKKIIILSLFALLGIALNAQDFALLQKHDYVYTGNEAISGTTAEYKTLVVDREYLYRYYIQVNLDSAGDGTDFTVLLRGSNDNTNWTTITTSNYGVVASVSNDTTIIFDNLSETNIISASVAAHTEIGKGTITAAQHTIVTAAATDYVNGILNGYDTLYTNEGVSDYIKDDTITVAQRTATVGATASTRADTVTVAAQTITTTETITSNMVTWKYLQVYVVGAGSSAGCTIDWITWAIRREE